MQTLGSQDEARLSILLGAIEADAAITGSSLSGWSWKASDAAKILTQYHVMGTPASEPGGSGLVAFVAYQELPTALEICAIGTHPLYRRGGLGAELLSELKALASARSVGAREIWLEVSERNRSAIDVYLAHGFRVVGQRPGYYPDGSSALVMSHP
ncbi:MAG: GNAT family N-acetyltransferase [Bdellovibrionales bacterium]|nr:GNAT family N-acetyltransferase [Bdellovibrionales bacterium]